MPVPKDPAELQWAVRVEALNTFCSGFVGSAGTQFHISLVNDRRSDLSSLIVPGLQIGPSEDAPEDSMRVLIHGLPGSGKTLLASTIAEQGKTLFVDLVGERGITSFKGAPYAKNIDLARPKTVVELTAIYKALAKGDHDYTAVVLDALSAVQKSAMRFQLGFEEDTVSEIRKGRQTADQRTWGTILEIMTDVCTFWMSLADGNRKQPMHVVFTCQTKAHEDDQGEVRLYPDVSKGSRSIAMATPDYVFYTDVVEEMSDEGESVMKYLVRVGPDPHFATKARIPASLRGKVPAILGRDGKPVSLTSFGRAIGKISK